MTRSLPLLAALALLSLLLGAVGAAAQDTVTAAPAADPCSQPGKSIQCNGFGSIAMDTQRDIKGDPVDLEATIWLNTNYASQGARWVLFSVRNNTADGSSPISIAVTRFATASGDVVTTRVDHPSAHEVDLWVDVLDTPVNNTISLDVQVGSSDRGAYRLEVLVLAFDRGYATLNVSGGQASLFSSTLLGVSRETGQISGAGSGSLLQGKKTPALALPFLALVLVAAVAVRRRRA